MLAYKRIPLEEALRYLVERLRRNASLYELDGRTLYGGGERGYTDYTTLQVLSS